MPLFSQGGVTLKAKSGRYDKEIPTISSRGGTRQTPGVGRRETEAGGGLWSGRLGDVRRCGDVRDADVTHGGQASADPNELGLLEAIGPGGRPLLPPENARRPRSVRSSSVQHTNGPNPSGTTGPGIPTCHRWADRSTTVPEPSAAPAPSEAANRVGEVARARRNERYCGGARGARRLSGGRQIRPWRRWRASAGGTCGGRPRSCG